MFCPSFSMMFLTLFIFWWFRVDIVFCGRFSLFNQVCLWLVKSINISYLRMVNTKRCSQRMTFSSPDSDLSRQFDSPEWMSFDRNCIIWNWWSERRSFNIFWWKWLFLRTRYLACKVLLSSLYLHSHFCNVSCHFHVYNTVYRLLLCLVLNVTLRSMLTNGILLCSRLFLHFFSSPFTILTSFFLSFSIFPNKTVRLKKFRKKRRKYNWLLVEVACRWEKLRVLKLEANVNVA